MQVIAPQEQLGLRELEHTIKWVLLMPIDQQPDQSVVQAHAGDAAGQERCHWRLAIPAVPFPSALACDHAEVGELTEQRQTSN